MKTLFKTFLIGALFSSISYFGIAQSPAPLQGLVQQSFQNFAKLKEAEQLIQAGELRVGIAKSALLPYVSAAGSYNYITPTAKATLPLPEGSREIQFVPNHNISLGVNGSYGLYDFGKTDLTIRQAQENVLVSRHNLELNRHNLAYQIAQLYYNIAFLQKSVSVQQGVIQTSEEVLKQVEQRLKNGDALEFDVVSQQVKLKLTQNRKIDFENQIEKQKAMLGYLTGTPSTGISISELAIENPPVPASAEELVTLANGNNKELLLAKDRILSAETEIAIAQKAHLPTIMLNGSMGEKNGYMPNVNQLRFNLAAGVSVNVPLYAGKRYDYQRKAAVANLEATKYNLESVNANLRKDVENVLIDIKSNQQRLQNVAIQVTQAERALAIAKNRLANGTITNVELESAQTGIEEARLSQLNYQFQLFMNQLELKRLVGDEFWK
ncbi:TolC family protein [Runella sp.]|uniref:TolC family protein n=1 Tax=Runella sp. TaxID=1960881 RepID=UPI003D13C6C4